ncbi:hypothetical protein CKO28_21410 [Rhodovibrio sodomensis]|uniref:Type II toxin-antitoxin system ParD family antitoxin n=1 Tax=Rhodovibrio sodomensis TaxID=1088 RepID=A0ABS1DKW6_9PROT|nr:type II toxin-antitoxin system ParD family antitoxin [Rhodovibrio sodomensis]MBK1670582.1 hypothetical protein [Rhodovibrio sodomensis]
MPTMNISLPESLRDFVERQVSIGGFGSSSEYMRDLIRRDQARSEKIAAMQERVDEARNSPDDTRTRSDLEAEGLRRARERARTS